MVDTWNDVVLMPGNVAWNISPRSLQAPVSVSGVSQVVSSDAGIWKCTFENIAIHRGSPYAQIVYWRGLQTRCEGRLVPLLVPRCAAWHPGGSAPTPIPEPAAGVPHSDDALFSDDVGYTGGTFVPPDNPANLPDYQPTTVTVAAARGYHATDLPVKWTLDAYGRSPVFAAGQDFSIGERMYRIHNVTTNPDGITATLLIRPPLRDPVAINAPLNFLNPVCRMRLATDDEMDLMLEDHRTANPTVNFIEDV